MAVGESPPNRFFTGKEDVSDVCWFSGGQRVGRVLVRGGQLMLRWWSPSGSFVTFPSTLFSFSLTPQAVHCLQGGVSSCKKDLTYFIGRSRIITSPQQGFFNNTNIPNRTE